MLYIRQYSIEMYYQNDTSKDPYLLTLPGCTPACPLEKFAELVSPVLVEDWSKACGNKDIMRGNIIMSCIFCSWHLSSNCRNGCGLHKFAKWCFKIIACPSVKKYGPNSPLIGKWDINYIFLYQGIPVHRKGAFTLRAVWLSVLLFSIAMVENQLYFMVTTL